ncbi:MAG: ORC1-type DNA replication protein [Candidatus Hadarchaeales archaeon]
MRRLFEEELERPSVFRDASKLSPDYVPPVLVHREEEFRWLVRVFRPLLENRMSQRVLITGSVGVGKTALARRFGSELESEAKGKGLNLSYLHINCRKEKSYFSVVSRIHHHYNPRWPHHGLSPEKLLDVVKTYMKAHDAYLVIGLDEADYYVLLNGPDLIYTLTRAWEEAGLPNRISVIAIAKDRDFLRKMDLSTQSTFMHNVLELNRYSAGQLRDILSQRVSEAFRSGTVEEEALDLIADIASSTGDARFALELLWRAGLIADGRTERTVTPEHVREAKAEVYPVVKREVLRELLPHEKILLLSLCRKLKSSGRAYVVSGELEKAYAASCEEYGEEPRKKSQFWEYLNRMEGLGLVDLKQVGGERESRISVQEIPVSWLEKELEKLLEGRKEI